MVGLSRLGWHLQQTIKKHNISCNCKMCTCEKNEAVVLDLLRRVSCVIFYLLELQFCRLVMCNDLVINGGKDHHYHC